MEYKRRKTRHEQKAPLRAECRDCDESKRLRFENDQYLEFCVSLVSMLQTRGCDPGAVLANAPLPDLKAAYARKRLSQRSLCDIPMDCASLILQCLHLAEACAFKRVSKHSLRASEESLKLPRRVVYRREVYTQKSKWVRFNESGAIPDWLRHVDEVCTNVTAVEIDNRKDALDLACYSSSVPAIRTLMSDARFDLRKLHPRKCPLFLAARDGATDVVERLLEYEDFNIGRIRSDGRFDLPNVLVKVTGANALHAACALGHADVACILLKRSEFNVSDTAKLEPIDRPPEPRDIEGKRASALHLAVCGGHAHVVRMLLEDGRVRVCANERNAVGKTALHMAAERMEVEVVRVLVACESVQVNSRDDKGCTPLHAVLIAASEYVWFAESTPERKRRAAACVELLLSRPECDVDAQCDVNAISISGGSEDENRMYMSATPLYIAAQMSDASIMSALMKPRRVNADVNLRSSKRGESPLQSAIRAGHLMNAPEESVLACVDLLLEHSSVDINAADEDGITPLSFAAIFESVAVMRRLLQRADINVNVVDKDKYTVLHYLVVDHPSLSKLPLIELLRDDARVNSQAADLKGDTALHTAAGLRCPAAVFGALLMFPGLQVMINARNANGDTPLMKLLASAGDTGHTAMTRLPCLEALARRNDVDFSVRNSSGRSVYHEVVLQCADAVEVVKKLASICHTCSTCKSGTSQSPPHGNERPHANQRPHESALRCVDINALDESGHSALHYAVMHRHAKAGVVDALLRVPGIDARRRRSSDNLTPREVAETMKPRNSEIIALLENH